MNIPNSSTVFPLAGYERLCFLNNMVDHPQITIGDYTYYDDFESVRNFQRNVRYLFDFTVDRLIIGKFCLIASGVEFIMNGASYLVDAVSSYPFAVFGPTRWGGIDQSGKSSPMLPFLRAMSRIFWWL